MWTQSAQRSQSLGTIFAASYNEQFEPPLWVWSPPKCTIFCHPGRKRSHKRSSTYIHTSTHVYLSVYGASSEAKCLALTSFCYFCLFSAILKMHISDIVSQTTANMSDLWKATIIHHPISSGSMIFTAELCCWFWHVKIQTVWNVFRTVRWLCLNKLNWLCWRKSNILTSWSAFPKAEESISSSVRATFTALGMWSVHLFGPDWNIPITAGWIGVKFSSNLHGYWMISPHKILLYPTLWLKTKYLRN